MAGFAWQGGYGVFSAEAWTDGEYVEIPAAGDGSLVSPGFPGLVIDVAALTSGDHATALARLG